MKTTLCVLSIVLNWDQFKSTTVNQVVKGARCCKAIGGPGAEKVLHFYLSSARQGTNCEAAKGLEGALPVQYFILMGSSGVIKGQR